MDLFKERKKNRRKKQGKKNASSTGDQTSANNSVCSGGSTKENTDDGGDDVKTKEDKPPSTVSEKVTSSNQPVLGESKGDPLSTSTKSADELLVEELTSTSEKTKKKKKKKKMKRQLSMDSVSGGDTSSHKRQELDTNPSPSTQQVEQTKHHVEEEKKMESTIQEEQPPPRSPPPPGFNASMSSLNLNENEGNPSTNGVSLNNMHHPLHIGLPPDGRYIIVPENDRPYHQHPSMPMPTKMSLAIPAAKAFVDLYYRNITMGQYGELCKYYTPHAQKSISVGGAHSVVASRRDIMLQLQSLSKSIFEMRGVVSQDSFDGRGAHILVTGTMQTGGVQTQFAHTISLVHIPQHSPFSFQIHNDALSLLTSGDEMAQQQSSQHNVHQSQSQPTQPGVTNGASPHPRPPGLV